MVNWARDAGGDVAVLWAECPRGDWLLGIAVRLGAEPQRIVAAAAATARTALDFLPDGDSRADDALSVAEAFSRDEADAAAVVEARQALEALSGDAPDPAVRAAAESALAALVSVEDPSVAPNAAAQAAQAAVFDAGDCAMIAALRFAQEKAAAAVRAHLDAEWAARAFAALG